MIAPLMVSIFTDGLRSVKPGWLEGSLALGVNRWRTTWKIGVRTARPAIVAGTVLATARAIGEAVMLAMISGSVGFAPNPADGLIFIYEPSRPLAPTIVKNIDPLSSPPANATLFAIAAVLLFSAAIFSLAGWVARRAMRKYGARLMESSVATPPAPGAADPAPAASARARSRAAPPGRSSTASAWRSAGRSGLLFCAIAVAIVVYLLRPGDQATCSPRCWSRPPPPASARAESGGFSDALIGTLIVAVMGIAIALPVGVGDRGLAGRVRPPGGARADHRVDDRGDRRHPLDRPRPVRHGDLLQHRARLPQPHLRRRRLRPLLLRRLGDALAGRAAADRRQHPRGAERDPPPRARGLLRGRQDQGGDDAADPPADRRPQVATGAMLGLGRIIGDTAIIVVLLGATQNFAPVEGAAFPLNYLRGAGTTLTNFVYEASPTGNLNQPEKAYAAAFVLLLMVLALNAAVDVVHRRARKVGTWSS